MKYLQIIPVLVIAFFFSIAISSCGGKNTHHDKSDNMEHQGPEYTSAYVCPMHCEGSGSDASGTCPVCGMDYVENKGHNMDGHKHGEKSDEHDHDGEDHDGHDH